MELEGEFRYKGHGAKRGREQELRITREGEKAFLEINMNGKRTVLRIQTERER
jgi:hypothetical protein